MMSSSRKTEDRRQRTDDRKQKTEERVYHLSGRRLWVFRIITAVVAPVLLVVLLEIILRIVGYGYPAGTFVKGRVEGKPAYLSNNEFGWQYFPPELSREFMPFVVPADKADNTYRIFILGESAAQGDPAPAYSFGRHLAVMLRQRYPSVNFEVTTAAMTAINSHAIVRIARDCARLKPDLFVVYAGNNEVVGPYGAGTVFTPLSKSLFLIRAGITIKTTKTGQLLTNLISMMTPRTQTPEKWGGLEMFLGKQIRHDDEQMQYVYSHFQRNLEDIIGIAQKSGAKIILSTVAVNLKDCPPFASMHRAGVDEQKKKIFDGLYQNGIELEKAGDFNEAIEKYLAAGKIDESYAELQFRLGRCLWKLGQFDKAKERYARAMELDTLRFRADSKINEIIRNVGENKAEMGVYFVDAAGAFEHQSPHGCPGFELFLEHVHPTFAGNFLLARTVFDQVEQILPDRIKSQKVKEGLPPSEDICAKQMAFTVYDNLRVMQANIQNVSSKQAFGNQAYHEETMDYWKQKADQLKKATGPAAMTIALEEYEQAIKFDGNSRWLRVNYAKMLLDGRKNTSAAAQQYRLVIEKFPQDYRAFNDLATMEMMMGDIDSAFKHSITAVELLPTSPLANYTAGAACQMKGMYKQAMKYFNESIRLNFPIANPYIRMGQILVQQGKINEAEQVYRKGIKALPDNPQLHLELAGLLKYRGLAMEAETERQKAITLDPNIAAQFGRSQPDETTRQPR